MKNILIIFFLFLCYNVVAQTRPAGVPTQFSTGWSRWGFSQSDSGLIIARRDTTFLPRFTGTIVMRPQDRRFYYYDSTDLRWYNFGTSIDTTSLSNRINLKLNITDTTAKWWGIGKRWVDTLYRVNDSTVGFTINEGAQQTFQILGRSPSGGGGSGTVTSVGLSLPSAFIVTPASITTSGIFAVTAAGTSAEYIRGNGTLATTDTGMIPDFHLKVRSLLSVTSPLTYNSTTGILGVGDANTAGTKGVATFSSSSFSDNGSGTISLVDVTTAGGCINCDITFDAKGRAISFASGTPPQFVNAPGAGDTLSRSDTLKRLNPGYGIIHAITDNNITQRVDTGATGLATQYDLTQISTLVNNGLSKNGDTVQLGQQVSAVGNPAALNSSREIPLNGFNTVFTGTGSIGIGTATPSSSYKMSITGTGSTGGISVSTSTGTGINVVSVGKAIEAQTSGVLSAITGSSSGGAGSYGVTGSGGIGGIGGRFYTIAAGGDASPVALELERLPTGGGVTNGAGFTIMLRNSFTNGTSGHESGRITNYFSNAVSGTQSSEFGFHLVNNAVSARKALLASNGQWTWDGYPALTAQIDTTVYKPLGIDGSGNVVKMAGWVGGGGAVILPATQIAFGGPSNTLSSESGFTYNSTNNVIFVDSIRTKLVTISPSLVTNDIVDVGNTDSDSELDSTGRFGWTQSETTSIGWPRKNIVSAFGYNDPQSASNYNPVAGSFYQHIESDFFGLFEFILGSITHSGFTQRHMFMHTNKYTGSSDMSMSFSEGFKIYGFDGTPYPYFAVAEGNTVTSGIDQTFKVENKNLTTGVVTGSFSIAPQSDGSVNLGTGVSTNTVSFGNTLSVSTGNQYMFTGIINNSNQGFSQLSGSTTAGGGYPFIINHEIGSAGGNIWQLRNTSTGVSALILAADGAAGDVMTIYRSNSNANDFTIGNSVSNNDFRITTGSSALLGGTNLMTVKPTQRIGIGGITSPTARIHLPGVTATANTASLKIDSGIVMITPEIGAIESDGDSLYWTNRLGIRTALNRIGSAATTIYSGDGSLAADRNIASAGFTLRLSGANNSDTLMSIVNTGTSSTGLFSIGSLFGIDAQSTTTGLRAFGSATGMTAEGGTNEGAIIKSDAIRGATIQSVPATTNTVQEVIRLERGVNGSPGANGIGGSANFYNKVSDNSSVMSNEIISKFTNATVGSRVSQISITGVNAAVTGTILTIDGDGTITTAGKRVMSLVTSSAGTLTIGNAEAYVFNGTTTTWTLPAVSGTTGTIYYLKNIGSGSITLNADAGNNEIYTSSAVNTTTITAGSAIILISNGTYFTVN